MITLLANASNWQLNQLRLDAHKYTATNPQPLSSTASKCCHNTHTHLHTHSRATRTVRRQRDRADLSGKSPPLEADYPVPRHVRTMRASITTPLCTHDGRATVTLHGYPPWQRRRRRRRRPSHRHLPIVRPTATATARMQIQLRMRVHFAFVPAAYSSVGWLLRRRRRQCGKQSSYQGPGNYRGHTHTHKTHGTRRCAPLSTLNQYLVALVSARMRAGSSSALLFARERSVFEISGWLCFIFFITVISFRVLPPILFFSRNNAIKIITI